jgi:hypothetical protein
VTQVAVRATRIVIRALMVPVTDHTRSKHQERDQREGHTENAKSLLHRLVNGPVNKAMIRNETGTEAIA